MMPIIIALFWAFVCPNQSNAHDQHNKSQVTTLDDDTGGETGRIPPRPPKNP